MKVAEILRKLAELVDTVEGRMIAVTPFITSVSSGDRVAIKWNATNAGVHIATLPPSGDIPRTPGVIVTVKQL